jgi:two-component system cell cycle response regulator
MINTIQVLRDENVELRERLRVFETLSVTDPLTGIDNRRGILRHLEQALEFTRRYSRPTAVVMIDVDNFKVINDSRGHAAGDEVLQMIASVAKNTLRGVDSVGRYGGDEFLLVLPDTDTSQATVIAEKLRSRIANWCWDPDRVTISCGATSTDLEGRIAPSPGHLIKRADAALYTAKGAGGNLVVTRNTS